MEPFVLQALQYIDCCRYTADREIFTLVSFDPRNFLTVDDYNMDEHLESFWCLVYYQVSGEPGTAGCSR